MTHPTSSHLVFFLVLLVAGCAGGGGGGGGVIDPPTPPTPFTPLAGITHAAPGSGTIRIDFTPPGSASFEVAAFVSTDKGTLFSTAPQAPAASETHVTVGGLTDGTVYFLGLGIRPTTGGTYSETGPVVTATPGAPIYVDSAAPAGGDGTTPATAFNGILGGVAAAVGAGSGNVWVKGGTYTLSQTLSIPAGVHVHGGFGVAFDLATRDPQTTPTVVHVPFGADGAKLSDQLNNSMVSLVDGIRFTGNDRGSVGIDVDSTSPCDIELRSMIVTDMLDRGMRIRNSIDNEFDAVITGCQSSRNGADGLSASGAWDYSIYGSLFGDNAQEGIELDGLVPETGGKATLEVESCQFFGNGAEGLDCSMKTPLVPTSGDFSVRIRGSAFERNSLAGCLIDSDFEAASGYSAKVLVRESLARGNGSNGFHLDLDGPLDLNEDVTAFVYRVLATSNAANGLYVTSESRPGFTAVSTSALVGNGNAGLRAEGPAASQGNRAVAVTHSLFAGNAAGGLISRDVAASAASSIAYRQTNAFDGNTTQVGNVSSNDLAAIGFVNAPAEYALVLSRSGKSLTLAAPCSFSTSAVLELADDTVQRTASSISGAGTVVTLSQAPLDFGTPGVLAAFAPGASDVEEDYTLGAGSIALGAGMNGADAGIFGSPVAGRPGVADEEKALDLFYATGTTPEISELVGASDTITIHFADTLDGASANASTVRAFRGAMPIGITLATSGAQLMIDPAGADWGAGDFRIELDGLTNSNGTVFSGPVVLPFSR